jgi:hypothetical protein
MLEPLDVGRREPATLRPALPSDLEVPDKDRPDRSSRDGFAGNDQQGFHARFRIARSW